MKLRNKKTGEIVNLDNTNFVVSSRNKNIVCSIQGTTINHVYNSLSEFVEEWEDYEEPKEKHWYMTSWGEVWQYGDDPLHEKWRILLGNDFETKEEAEKAVEKLKAVKRLKDHGFKFDGWSTGLGKNEIYTIFWSGNDGDFDLRKDLDLLFCDGKE